MATALGASLTNVFSFTQPNGSIMKKLLAIFALTLASTAVFATQPCCDGGDCCDEVTMPCCE